MMVSLGIIWRPRELVIIEVPVLLFVAQALIINRLAGLPYLGNAFADGEAEAHDLVKRSRDDSN